MKSYKVRDITDVEFLITCVYKAFKGKWNRVEVKTLLSKCKGDTIEVKIANLAKAISTSLKLEQRKMDIYRVNHIYDVHTHISIEILHQQVCYHKYIIGYSFQLVKICL